MRIKRKPSRIEIDAQPLLPPGRGIQQTMHRFAARAGLVAIVNVHALAVVGDNGKHVRTAASARAAKQRLDQAQREASQPKNFQRGARELDGRRRARAPVAPQKCGRAHAGKRKGDPTPRRRFPDK